MSWNLSASGIVGEVAGEAAAAAAPEAAKLEHDALAAVEQELVSELRRVLSNPKFHVLSSFFNGAHTGTVSDLHVPAPEPAAAPAAEPEPAAPAAEPEPAPAPEQPEQPEQAAVSGDGGE